jgi:hypothetical protein
VAIAGELPAEFGAEARGSSGNQRHRFRHGIKLCTTARETWECDAGWWA